MPTTPVQSTTDICLTNVEHFGPRLTAHADSVPAGTPSQQKVLWMALFVPGLEGRRGLPYVLVAEPGTVKTSSIRWLTEKAGLPFHPVLGSIRQPIDFMGCPVPQRRDLGPHDQHLAPNGEEDLLYMHYAPAGFAVEAALQKNAVILFDEANNMPPAVQSAMLRVLFEGVVGEIELPPGIRFLLATNSIEDAAGGWDISQAMKNRIGWLQWEGSSVDRFSAYLAQSGGIGRKKVEPINHLAEEAAVDKAWGDAWTRAVTLVTGFLSARDELFHKKSTVDNAWPSSRTWDFMCHALAGSFVYDLNQIERRWACAAYIGDATYAEFFAWAKDADLPDPTLFLDGKIPFIHKAERLDRTAALLHGCMSKILPENADRRQDRANTLWKFLRDLPADATDVSMAHVIRMTEQGLFHGNDDAYKVLAKTEICMDVSGV